MILLLLYLLYFGLVCNAIVGIEFLATFVVVEILPPTAIEPFKFDVRKTYRFVQIIFYSYTFFFDANKKNKSDRVWHLMDNTINIKGG